MRRVTILVTNAEHADLVARAERSGVSITDFIKRRLSTWCVDWKGNLWATSKARPRPAGER